MTYTHRMLPLPSQYDTAAVEKKWQTHWLSSKIYSWSPDISRENSYVIDTPPPTVSGTLHMGHVFSYTQADFIARFQRMTGKNVFYPMGFDDNGLPTERLVEKTRKIRATDMSREEFINICLEVSEEARKEFRALFESIALSVDWDQEYHTISKDSRRLSQLSFLDLVNKGHCYRAQRPFYWDPVDQTAIASAEIEDKELPSFANDILFTCEGEKLTIMTTRPELLPACVALFCHPEDARYTHLIGKHAEVPLFGFTVPILTDDSVDMEKGTGLMMCCTFGDDADIVKWSKHQLPTRVVVNKLGRMDFSGLDIPPPAPPVNGGDGASPHLPANSQAQRETPSMQPETPSMGSGTVPPFTGGIEGGNPKTAYQRLQGLKISNADPKHPGARQIIITLLEEAGLLISKKPITHTVKCAERSGAPLEILPTHQWFVKVTDKKEELKNRARECNWNPDWMRLRIEQWIDGLNQDWCISRQRYFGVPFPVWYGSKDTPSVAQKREYFYAAPDELPVNPLSRPPKGFSIVCEITDGTTKAFKGWIAKNATGEQYQIYPDLDVMDTWATSSISPQLSAGAINADLDMGHHPPRLRGGIEEGNGTTHTALNHFAKLFPADLRPQAHEIIRTWAFYTLVKSHLHNNSIPWHNLMISGWCLAEDKSKMSKSKGNVVTPVALIEERGTDAVRYWAATSRLGQDTAFSPDLLKIGKKLVGKLWNATAFAAIHLSKMSDAPTTPTTDTAITETLDRWILSRLGQTVAEATEAFRGYEYADALDATNRFFWADFCDNYLELIKKRVYNEDGSATPAAQQSAIRTLYYVLDGILKLYAPFTPHVTEELYAHIFPDAYAARGSLHAMGTWPNAADYPAEVSGGAYGEIATAILEQVRKAKSDAKRSIKTPVTHAKLHLIKYLFDHPAMLESMLADVKSAGNIEQLETISVGPDQFRVEVILADAADAA